MCATWGVAVREGNRLRPRQQLAAELRGACVRVLKEDTAATVPLQSTEASISASDSASMVVQAPVENVRDDAASLQPEDVRTLTTALAMVRQKHIAQRTRVTGKKQAVPAVPADLRQAIESLHEHGTLTWAERKPWMILGGCKEKRKHDGKFVRPANSLALWEAERVLVERLRLQLQVDPECRVAYHGPELRTPRTLKAFAESLKEEGTRCITPFGNDFRQVHLPTQWDGQHVMRRLALLEGGLVSADSRCEWPLLDGLLLQEIWENRSSVDPRSKITGLDALVNALETCRLGMPDQGAWFQSAWKVKEKQHLETLVSDMDIFFAEYDLRDLWTSVSQGTLMVWIAWFAILKEHTSKKAKAPEICTESCTLLKGPEPKYVLSDRLNTYAEPAYFQRDSMCMRGIASDNYDTDSAAAREGLPELSPPRLCELCGAGFVTWSDLNKHVEVKHGNWAEYRKRVFWHAQFDTQHPCYGLPLSWKRKRRMIANATTRLVSSTKLHEEGAEGERPTPPERFSRKMVGCAVCATKMWEERMRRCYMFRKLGLGEEASKQEEVEEERAQSDASGEDQVSRVRGRQRLLSDKKGILYFGPADVVQKFLAVEKYQERWPLIPARELHASSVQHPLHPEYRWLLHSRRVPVLAEASSGQVGGDLPRCAGVGDPDRTVLLCPWCARNLCHRKPTLPPRSLANDMWGGREHPLYQRLRTFPAAKMLLGQGRVLYRKVVLNKKHGREASEAQHGLQGNTTFIAQPKTSAIEKVLPPPMSAVGDTLQVIFSVSRQDVAKAQPLQVPRTLYVQCAELRRDRCALYQDVTVDAQRAEEVLRDDEAPPEIVAAAVHMSEANLFRPNLTGPAGSELVGCLLTDTDLRMF